MSNLAIDPVSGDLIIGRGATRIAGVDYTAQLLRSRLQTLLGEWEQDTELGIDWLGMLGRKAPLLEIERKLRTLILETSDVKAIVSLTIVPDYRYRKLAIDFVVLSTFGTVEGAVINLGVGA
jgi:hypothetical protein